MFRGGIEGLISKKKTRANWANCPINDCIVVNSMQFEPEFHDRLTLDAVKEQKRRTGVDFPGLRTKSFSSGGFKADLNIRGNFH